jgi:hypothetical protein
MTVENPPLNFSLRSNYKGVVSLQRHVNHAVGELESFCKRSMDEGIANPPKHVVSKASRLSHWPRYPGGAIAGALNAAASILIFFIDRPALRNYLRAAGVFVVVLWVRCGQSRVERAPRSRFC